MRSRAGILSAPRCLPQGVPILIYCQQWRLQAYLPYVNSLSNYNMVFSVCLHLRRAKFKSKLRFLLNILEQFFSELLQPLFRPRMPARCPTFALISALGRFSADPALPGASRRGIAQNPALRGVCGSRESEQAFPEPGKRIRTGVGDSGPGLLPAASAGSGVCRSFGRAETRSLF